MIIDNILFALDVIRDSDGKRLRPPPNVGNPTVNGSHVLLIGYLAGWAGIDRFMVGHVGLGIAKLLTCGGCSLWWMIDTILCAVGHFRDKDGNSLKWD
jgi:TM2 domain-containing membrane protein YozV